MFFAFFEWTTVSEIHIATDNNSAAEGHLSEAINYVLSYDLFAFVTRPIYQNKYKDASISNNRDDVYDEVNAHKDLICPNLLHLLFRLIHGNFAHDVS